MASLKLVRSPISRVSFDSWFQAIAQIALIQIIWIVVIEWKGKLGESEIGEEQHFWEQRTKNKLNLHMAPSPWIESAPHWWKLNAITCVQTLLPWYFVTCNVQNERPYNFFFAIYTLARILLAWKWLLVKNHLLNRVTKALFCMSLPFASFDDMIFLV